MRALVLEPGRGLSLVDLPPPEPGPGEALIGIRRAGICRTDLELVRGYMGFRGVPGHEFVGEVLETTSPADRVLIGARVAGEINLGCGDCIACAEGMSRHCPRRKVLGLLGKDGAYAELLTLPVSNLRAVPDSISDRQAVFIEPAAAAFEILDQVQIAAAYRVLVLGDGKLGLLVAQVAATKSRNVVVAGHHEAKLAIARRWGLETVNLKDEEGEAGFDVVVECTGSPAALGLAIDRVRPRGTVIMKTTASSDSPFPANRVVVDEITLIGSRCGRFEPAIAALVSGDVRVEDLIADEFDLHRGAEAFERAAAPGVLKVLLRVSG